MVSFDIFQGKLGLDTSAWHSAIKGAQPALENFTANMQKSLGVLKQGVANVATAFAGIAATLTGVAAVSIKAAGEQAAAEKKLAAVLKATGEAAGFTKGELVKLAGELQNVTNYEDEVVINAQAILATFREIKGDQFKEATKAALDMNAVMGGELQGTILQIGKALQDPVLGMTALRRSGVSFNATQQETIKGLVATGNLLGAQKMILAELKQEFGGAAEAMASPWRQMKIQIGEVFEAIGFILLPLRSQLGAAIRDVAMRTSEWVNANRELISGKLNEYLHSLGESAKNLGGWFVNLYNIAQPTMSGLLTQAQQAWMTFSGWFATLDKGTQDTLKIAAAFTLAGGTLQKLLGNVPFVGQFAAAIGGIINPLNLLGGAVKFVLPLLSAGTGLFGAFTSIAGMVGIGGPLMLALAALAAFIVTGGDFGGALEGLGELLRDVGVHGFEALKGTIEAFSGFLQGDALAALAGYHKGLAGLSEIGGDLAGKAGLGGLSDAFRELAQAQRELSGSEARGSAQNKGRQGRRADMFGDQGAATLKAATDAAQEVASLKDERSGWQNSWWLRGTEMQERALERINKKLAVAIAKRDSLMNEAARIRGEVAAPLSPEDQAKSDQANAANSAAAAERWRLEQERAESGIRASRKATRGGVEDEEDVGTDGMPMTPKQIAAAKKQAKAVADARKAIRAQQLAKMNPADRKRAQAADKAADVASKAAAAKNFLNGGAPLDEQRIVAEEQIRDKARADFANSNPALGKAAATGQPAGATPNVNGKEIPIINVDDEERSAPSSSGATRAAKQAGVMAARQAAKDAASAARQAKKEAYLNRATIASDKAAKAADDLAKGADDAATATEKLTQADEAAAEAKLNAAGQLSPRQQMAQNAMAGQVQQAAQQAAAEFAKMAQGGAQAAAAGPGEFNALVAQANKAGNPQAAIDLIISYTQQKLAMASANENSLATGDLSSFGLMPGYGNQQYLLSAGDPGAVVVKQLSDLLATLTKQRAALGRGKGIPKMAAGGIVNNSLLANIGEDGPEAVIPLQKLGSVLASVLPRFGSSSVFGNVGPFGQISGMMGNGMGGMSSFLNTGALGAIGQAFIQAQGATNFFGNAGLSGANASSWAARLSQVGAAQQAALGALTAYQQHSQINLQPVRGSRVFGGTNAFGAPYRGMTPGSIGAGGARYSGDTTPQYQGPNITVNIQGADLTTPSGARAVAAQLVPHIDAVVRRAGTDMTGMSSLRSPAQPFNAAPTGYAR